MSLTLLALPAALLLLGFPIFVVLLAAATATLLLYSNVPLAAVHQNMFAGVNAFALLAVPFFLFSGEIMARGSFARRLTDVMDAGLGAFRGSLALTTVASATAFGAISGSSAASVATIGRVMYPAMIQAGYPRARAAGLVTAVGAIDVVIPPSIPMILYGMVTAQSVPRLYAAGIFPGLLIAVLLMGWLAWDARRSGLPAGDAFRSATLATSIRRGAWALGAPVIVLGGIYGGVFSPTEAAAVAGVYAILVTRLVYRELGWPDILDAAIATVRFTGQVLIVVACANVFAWLLTINQVPARMVGWFSSTEIAPWQLLLAINLLLLAVGCILDSLSAILMLSPLLLPLVAAAGIDPVHFGIIVTVNLAIGLFSPPFGINIFVAQSSLGLPLSEIYRGVLPFLAIYLVALTLITFVPAISMTGVHFFMAR